MDKKVSKKFRKYYRMSCMGLSTVLEIIYMQSSDADKKNMHIRVGFSWAIRQDSTFTH